MWSPLYYNKKITNGNKCRYGLQNSLINIK
jgi:hypothetical protein